MSSSHDSASAVTSDPVLTVLRGARELLTPEGAWTQNEYAKTRTGRPCSVTSPRAVCWCLDGALWHETTAEGWDQAREAVIAVLDSPPSFILVWNDDPDRTQAEVLALLDRAIAARQAQS